MRTRLAAALVLLLHLFAPVGGNGSLARPSDPSIQAVEAVLTHFVQAAGHDQTVQAAEHPRIAQTAEHPRIVQAAEHPRIVQAAGHPREERASRGHPPAMAAAGSGGLAVLPGAAVPVPNSPGAAVVAALRQPCPTPDRRAAPARAPPASTR
ncbi:hypothetical protein [Nonomuraea sp. NPDC050691]|uniref:hypothetical protein n=1 Tax=Nonomuraea sp. NPDC050691 TaxID=3155661 RepID=UPI0033F54BF4